MGLAATITARERGQAMARARAEEAARMRAAAAQWQRGARREDAARRAFAARCLEFADHLDAMSRARTVTVAARYL